jgi:acetyltransferase-like isoleucine patch superfamily enzyme
MPLIDIICRFVNKLKRKSICKKLPPFGKSVSIAPDAVFYGYNVHIGDYVSLGAGAVFMCTRAPIRIGDHTLFGPNVTMITGNHRVDMLGEYIYDVDDSKKLPENDLPITLEGDNWIGANVTILKGVTVGRGAVVAAGAVVTKDIPPYTIAGGIPAKVIKPRFNDEDLEKHLSLLAEKEGKTE